SARGRSRWSGSRPRSPWRRWRGWPGCKARRSPSGARGGVSGRGAQPDAPRSISPCYEAVGEGAPPSVAGLGPRRSGRADPKERHEALPPTMVGEPEMADVSGGELVTRVLAREGVRHLFTLCGGHILPIYDACLRDGITVVDTRHEQAAAH